MRLGTAVALGVCAVVTIGQTGCGGGDESCEGPNGPCTEIFPGDNAQEAAQVALIEAEPGDVILFRAGTYDFTRELSLDVDNVTIRGEGMDDTILSFAEQVEGAQGVLITADDFTMEDIAVEDTRGDAVKIEGTDGVFLRNVRVEWTGGASSTNGAYGLYPVQTRNVLIDGCVAIGASDAGIYVGQSENVIVRNSRAEYNVAGIEIENTNGADVYNNVATNNTGGVLVFNLPGLQLTNGYGTRVYDNEIYDNNTLNFAPAGNIVGKVPTGTGFATIAGHDIEVFDNSIRDNNSVNFAAVSYLITEIEYDDPDYDPYPDTIYAHDNEFVGGGTEPTGELGFLLVQGLITIQEAPVLVPDLVFDGVVDPDKAASPGVFLPEYNLCFENNGDADFANLDWPNDYANVTTDLAPHTCSHPRIDPVVIPGVE